MKLNFALQSHRKSIVITWLFSYLSVLLFPLFTGIIIYIQAKDIVEKQIIENNNLTLNIMMKSADDVLSENVKLTNFIAFDANVNKALSFSSPLTSNDYYTLYKLMQEMKNYAASLKFSAPFYLYLKEPDLIVTPYSMMTTSEYYNAHINPEKETFFKWKQSLTSHLIPYLKPQDIDISINKQTLYITSLPLSVTNTKNGAVIIENKNSILDISPDTNIQSKVAILDNANFVILSSSSFFERSQIIKEQPTDKKYVNIKGKKYIVQRKTSKNSGYQYVAAVEYAQVLKQLNYLKITGIFLIILAFAGGVMLTLYLIKKNYSPLEYVVSSLKEKQLIGAKERSNEFELISNVIANILDENNSISVKLESQNARLKNQFMQKLLKGQYLGPDSTLKDTLNIYQVKFCSDYFLVGIFYIEDFKELFADDRSNNEAEQLSVVHYVIKNVTEELIERQNNYGIMAEVDNTPAILISFAPENIKDAELLAKEVFTKAQNFIKENLKITTTVAFSKVHKGLPEIASAYQEVQNVLEYKLILGKETLISATELQPEEKTSYMYTFEKEQKIINCIHAGDFENASLLVNDLFKISFENEIPNLNLARCLAFDMVGTILKITNSQNTSKNEKNALNISTLMEKLLEWTTIDSLKEQLLAIIHNLCLQNTNSHENDFEQRVLQIVESCYRDSNLSVAMIAAKLNIHPTYLSGTFKERTGMGLLDCINRYRIQISKDLLKNSNKNINEISVEVGYLNPKTFLRLFKKYEGTTPVKFKGMQK